MRPGPVPRTRHRRATESPALPCFAFGEGWSLDIFFAEFACGKMVGRRCPQRAALECSSKEASLVCGQGLYLGRAPGGLRRALPYLASPSAKGGVWTFFSLSSPAAKW